MYKFSAPMPYTKEDINRLLDINNKVEKSKITSLYASVPSNCKIYTNFEQARNFNFSNSNWDYWKSLFEYVLSKNCDFIYLLNSPRPFDNKNPDFLKDLEKLDLLLSELKKIGIKKLRIASTQLIKYIANHYPEFDILASTSFEYKTIWEYQNFIKFYPKIKQIVPSHDLNKNFKLLEILRKNYPDIEIELMVNEGCLQGCTNRMFHELINIDNYKISDDDTCLSSKFATSFCFSILDKYPYHSLIIGNIIFPWDIKEYEKIGITNFKLVGRDGYFVFEHYLKGFTMYLKGIDNVRNIKDYGLAYFTNHLYGNPVIKQLTIKDYKRYLPDIKHFKKYGYMCASRCGVECTYCYKCAEKIEKVFKKKQEEMRKRTIPVCVITKETI